MIDEPLPVPKIIIFFISVQFLLLNISASCNLDNFPLLLVGSSSKIIMVLGFIKWGHVSSRFLAISSSVIPSTVTAKNKTLNPSITFTKLQAASPLRLCLLLRPALLTLP